MIRELLKSTAPAPDMEALRAAVARRNDLRTRLEQSRAGMAKAAEDLKAAVRERLEHGGSEDAARSARARVVEAEAEAPILAGMVEAAESAALSMAGAENARRLAAADDAVKNLARERKTALASALAAVIVEVRRSEYCALPVRAGELGQLLVHAASRFTSPGADDWGIVAKPLADAAASPAWTAAPVEFLTAVSLRNSLRELTPEALLEELSSNPTI